MRIDGRMSPPLPNISIIFHCGDAAFIFVRGFTSVLKLIHTGAAFSRCAGSLSIRTHMTRQSSKSRNDCSFTCISCKFHVPAKSFGTNHRNHCPRCLWSRHLDEQTGDRSCACQSPMEPIGIEVRRDGEWAIIHRCTGCHILRTNRIGGDDDERALLALALRPIARPAFPLDDIRAFSHGT